MSGDGGSKKPKVTVEFKLPPIRTKREWREYTTMKLRQYEAIGYEIMGKRRGLGDG
jgi:hypothetical protein